MRDIKSPLPRGQWQFSLGKLFIAFTLLAVLLAPMAYWGLRGAFPIVLFLATVAGWYCLTRFQSAVLKIGVGAILILLLLALLIPPKVGSRTAANRMQCLNSLHQLSLAMQLYHNDHGHFPPAYVADARGKPLLSWRVLLLPYLGEKQKFAAIKLDEPWNSPHNSQYADCPNIFHCPSDPSLEKNSRTTNDVVVTGPGTAFPNDQSTSIDDFKNDGTSKAILIVEVANSGIHWMEPRDLNIQQMATTINAAKGQGVSSQHQGGAMVVFADGHTQFLPNSVTPEQLRAMLTVDGGVAESPVPEFD